MSLSLIAKAALAPVLGFDPLTRWLAKDHIFILLYHRILPMEACRRAPTNDALHVSIEDFADHIKFLNRTCTLVTLEEAVTLATRAEKAKRGVRPIVAITFDDGWLDNYTQAWPILKEQNTPWTLFLATECINSGFDLWWHTLEQHLAAQPNKTPASWIQTIRHAAESAGCHQCVRALDPLLGQVRKPEQILEALKNVPSAELEQLTSTLQRALPASQAERSLLNWNEVKEMAASGVSIGAHTRRHEILTLLNDSDIEQTIRRSVDDIVEQQLNTNPIFSYPSGETSERVQAATRKAGFVRAVGTRPRAIRPGTAPPMDIPRINIGGGVRADLTMLKKRLSQSFWRSL